MNKIVATTQLEPAFPATSETLPANHGRYLSITKFVNRTPFRETAC